MSLRESFRDRINDIPATYVGAGTAEGKHAYVTGARDMRYWAAEIGKEADTVIAVVEAEIADLQTKLAAAVTSSEKLQRACDVFEKNSAACAEEFEGRLKAESKLAEAEKDAAKWRAFCLGWTDDDENGVSTWQGYTISHWTGEAWGPDGFRFDEGDIEAAKVACLEHFKTHEGTE